MIKEEALKINPILREWMDFFKDRRITLNTPYEEWFEKSILIEDVDSDLLKKLINFLNEKDVRGFEVVSNELLLNMYKNDNQEFRFSFQDPLPDKRNYSISVFLGEDYDDFILKGTITDDYPRTQGVFDISDVRFIIINVPKLDKINRQFLEVLLVNGLYNKKIPVITNQFSFTFYVQC